MAIGVSEDGSPPVMGGVEGAQEDRSRIKHRSLTPRTTTGNVLAVEAQVRKNVVIPSFD